MAPAWARRRMPRRPRNSKQQLPKRSHDSFSIATSHSHGRQPRPHGRHEKRVKIPILRSDTMASCMGGAWLINKHSTAWRDPAPDCRMAAMQTEEETPHVPQHRDFCRLGERMFFPGADNGAKHRLGADQARRDRGRSGRGRRLRSNGADDAARDPEKRADEAADGSFAQGWRVRRRSADLYEVE